MYSPPLPSPRCAAALCYLFYHRNWKNKIMNHRVLFLWETRQQQHRHHHHRQWQNRPEYITCDLYFHISYLQWLLFRFFVIFFSRFRYLSQTNSEHRISLQTFIYNILRIQHTTDSYNGESWGQKSSPVTRTNQWKRAAHSLCYKILSHFSNNSSQWKDIECDAAAPSKPIQLHRFDLFKNKRIENKIGNMS